MTQLSRELSVTPMPESIEVPGFGFLPLLPGVPLAPEGLARFLNAVWQRLLPWLVPLALLALWQLSASRGWLSNRVLPAPLDVAGAGWTLAASGELWTHVRVSSGRALTGLAIGGGLGLLLGLLTGSVRWAETLLDSTIQMVRNIPALALIPLVILWFGIDESAKLFLIAVAVFFPIYLNTFHGIRNVDPGLIEMGRTYGHPDHPARRHLQHSGGPAVFSGADVGDSDRGRDHLRPGRHWLHDHECARIFADRHRAGGHPALRGAGQAGRPVCAGAGAQLAALASGLPERGRSMKPMHFRQLELQSATATSQQRTVVSVPHRPADGQADPPAQISPGADVVVHGVAKSFADRPVLRDVDLRLAPGEFVAIVGRFEFYS